MSFMLTEYKRSLVFIIQIWTDEVKQVQGAMEVTRINRIETQISRTG